VNEAAPTSANFCRIKDQVSDNDFSSFKIYININALKIKLKVGIQIALSRETIFIRQIIVRGQHA
jgi:hypothetical protein